MEKVYFLSKIFISHTKREDYHIGQAENDHKYAHTHANIHTHTHTHTKCNQFRMNEHSQAHDIEYMYVCIDRDTRQIQGRRMRFSAVSISV